ncbi:hypothetical protein HGRIS_007336 [Hohenbuehelia grisea]|uniref:TRAM domain-containing protein n=1 Tax=Hohenbuehelia grisea TaxID=104357 RepID=A0ABR3J4V0_9AGAR
MADTTTGHARPLSDSDSGQPTKKQRLDKHDTKTTEDGAQEKKKQPKKISKRSKKKARGLEPEPYSNDDVLWRDIVQLLGKDAADQAIEEGTETDSPFEFREEIDLDIAAFTSSGEGIGIAQEPKRRWAVIVPFSLPGEKVRARIYRNQRLHSFADFVEVITPNPELRDNTRVQCKHFGACAGCQYQMLSYEKQLDLKRDVVVKAYKNFSDLPDSSMPEIGSTIASPLQYGYRTKLTPHFEAPPKKLQKTLTPVTGSEKPDWLKIGFNRIGTRNTMDIEECPIATSTIRDALGPTRENIIQNIHTYKRGVSLLLRDSIDTTSAGSDPVSELAESLEKHVCVKDHKATIRERVGDLLFEYQAGSFFQNNNSVLIPLTSYVRDAIFAPTPSATAVVSTNERPTHLVDAYCGSGLFALSLAPHFEIVAGIELSVDSIRFATRNAELNKMPAGKCTFRSGDAANIFDSVGEFPPERTVLVIDPPRKGCDERFLSQLLAFRAAKVVYVSCNVHTQARDIGAIVGRTAGEPDGKRYVLESLRGFDLFPQTAHVESVAVLKLV